MCLVNLAAGKQGDCCETSGLTAGVRDNTALLRARGDARDGLRHGLPFRETMRAA